MTSESGCSRKQMSVLENISNKKTLFKMQDEVFPKTNE